MKAAGSTVEPEVWQSASYEVIACWASGPTLWLGTRLLRYSSWRMLTAVVCLWLPSSELWAKTYQFEVTSSNNLLWVSNYHLVRLEKDWINESEKDMAWIHAERDHVLQLNCCCTHQFIHMMLPLRSPCKLSSLAIAYCVGIQLR